MLPVVKTVSAVTLVEAFKLRKVIQQNKEHHKQGICPASQPVTENTAQHNDHRKQQQQACSRRNAEERIVTEEPQRNKYDKHNDFHNSGIDMVLLEYRMQHKI